MRIYKVESKTESKIVAAHTNKDAEVISKLSKVTKVTEIDIYNPCIICNG